MPETRSCATCGAPLPGSPKYRGEDRMHGIEGECEIFVCESCGTGITLPRIEEADLAALYPSAYAPHLEHSEQKGIRRALSRLIEGIHRLRHLHQLPLKELPSKPGTMLDVGCGRGDQGALLIGEGWKVTGIEPSADACEVAESQGLEMFCGTLATVDLTGRQFDAICFQHSLEHVYDPNVDLDRVLQYLAPGGQLLVSVPNFGSWQRKLFGADWYHLDLPRHRYHYTAEGLKDLFERHGLRVTATGSTTSPFGVTGSATYKFKGGWIYDTPAKSAAIAGASIAFHPINWAIGKIGGGDYLHVVAEKPA